MLFNLQLQVFVLCSFLNPFTCFTDFETGARIPCTSGGVCTPTSECPPAEEAILSLRKHGFIRCGFTGVDIDAEEIVCCPENNYPPTVASTASTSTNPIPTTTVATIVSTSTQKDNSTGVVENRRIVLEERKSKRACRNYTNKRVTRVGFNIYDGINATLGELPHMAIIGMDTGDSDTLRWSCGGSLISEKFVLTAAHCVNGRGGTPVRIRLGLVDLLERDAVKPQEFGIRTIKLHENYNAYKQNDIALLELDNEVKFTPEVHPACLYQEDDDPPKLVISGWGDTEADLAGLGSQSQFLLKADINSVSVNQCAMAYRNRLILIISTQICARSADGKADTCLGDSGGPLQLKVTSNSSNTIVGVTSQGPGITCGGDIPGVYTRVYSYLDWIENIVWP